MTTWQRLALMGVGLAGGGLGRGVSSPIGGPLGGLFGQSLGGGGGSALAGISALLGGSPLGGGGFGSSLGGILAGLFGGGGAGGGLSSALGGVAGMLGLPSLGATPGGGGSGSVGFLGASADIGGIATSISAIASPKKPASLKAYGLQIEQERYREGIRPSLANDLTKKVKTLLASGTVGFGAVSSVLGYLPGNLLDEGQEALVRGSLALSAPQFNRMAAVQSTVPVMPTTIGRPGSASWLAAKAVSDFRYNPWAFLGG